MRVLTPGSPLLRGRVGEEELARELEKGQKEQVGREPRQGGVREAKGKCFQKKGIRAASVSSRGKPRTEQHS